MNWKSALTTIAVVLGIVLSAKQLFEWGTAPTTSLEAIVEYDSFFWPKEFTDWTQGLRDKLSVDSLVEKINYRSFTGQKIDSVEYYDIVRSIVQSTSYHFQESIPFRGIPEPLDQIRGYWMISLKNGDDQELESVELFLPNAIFVEVKREGLDRRSLRIGEVYSVGRMRPGEQLGLIAWTTSDAETYTNQLRVTHKGGSGEISIRRRVGPMGQFFDNYWPILALITFWIVVLLAYLLDRYYHSKVTNGPSPDDVSVSADIESV